MALPRARRIVRGARAARDGESAPTRACAKLASAVPATLGPMSSTAFVPRALSPAAVVVLLTLLLGVQPIATDVYLPALPTVQRELGASVAATQLTLSALVVCFGLAQLACGPIADRWGRRPVLLGGMALYTA